MWRASELMEEELLMEEEEGVSNDGNTDIQCESKNEGGDDRVAMKRSRR